MKEFGIFCLFLVGGFLGGIVGYSIGNYKMRHEAIGNNAAHWQEVPGSYRVYNQLGNMIGTMETEFSWGPAEQKPTILK